MITHEKDGGIAVLRMTHGKANALDIEFCNALADRFDALRDSEAGAIVLTGQDTGKAKMFSAGVELKRLSAGGPDYVRAFLPALHRLYEAVFFHPKPVVAAINGHAIAGGAILAACADRRIMGAGCGRIGVTELQVGVPFPSLAFEVLRFAVPQRYLSEFALAAGTYDTDAALTRGWIDEIAEPEDVLADAVAVARELALLSPSAFAQTKAQLRGPAAEWLKRHGEATDKTVTEIWCAAEAQTRIADYVARTLRK
jgi:enoyl-CoA hydratase